MKWYGEPERFDTDRMPNCEACAEECMATGAGSCADCCRQTANGEFAPPPYLGSRQFGLDDLLVFATIAANAAEHQLDPEEADAEFNAVLVDLDADDASFLVDLMFYNQLPPNGAPDSSSAHPQSWPGC